MKRKLAAVFLAMAMFALGFVGCGQVADTTKSADNTTTKESATTKASEATQAAKPVTIRLYVPYGEQEPGNKPTKEIVDQFMKDNPNIKVELEVQAGTQYHDKLSTEIASDTLANVFVSWGGGEMYEAVKAGKLLDMKDFIKNSDPKYKDGFLKSALTNDNVTYPDIPGLWGVPFSNVAAGFYYNKDLFKKAGTNPPKTWDEMYTVIDKLKAVNTIPWVIGAKDGWRVEHLYSDLFYKWNGVAASKKLADRSMKYSDPDATKPWEVMLKLKDMGAFGPNPASVDFGMEQTLFKTGKAAMNFSLSAFCATFSGPDSEIKDAVGFFPTPAFTEKPDYANDVFAGGDCAYNLSAKQSPEEKTATYKLVTALTDKAGQEKYLNANAFLLTRTDLQGDPAKANPILADMGKLLANAKAVQTYVTVPDKISSMLNKLRSVATAVVNGQLNPKQAGAEMDNEIAKNK